MALGLGLPKMVDALGVRGGAATLVRSTDRISLALRSFHSGYPAVLWGNSTMFSSRAPKLRAIGGGVAVIISSSWEMRRQ